MGVVAKSTGDSMQLETKKCVLQGCYSVLVKNVFLTTDNK